MVVVLGVIVGKFLMPHWNQDEAESILEHLPLLPVSLGLVGTALLHDFYMKQALGEHLKTYRRMRALFGKAARILENCLGTPGLAPEQRTHEAQSLLRKLVEEALAENGGWLLLRRGRPVEVPRP
jgi:hypothetical protein